MSGHLGVAWHVLYCLAFLDGRNVVMDGELKIAHSW